MPKNKACKKGGNFCQNFLCNDSVIILPFKQLLFFCFYILQQVEHFHRFTSALPQLVYKQGSRKRIYRYGKKSHFFLQCFAQHRSLTVFEMQRKCLIMQFGKASWQTFLRCLKGPHFRISWKRVILELSAKLNYFIALLA